MKRRYSREETTKVTVSTEESDSQEEDNQSLNEEDIFFDAQEKLVEPGELGGDKRQRRLAVKYSDLVM